MIWYKTRPVGDLTIQLVDVITEEAVDLKLVDEVRAILPEHQNNKKKRRKK